MGVSILVQLVTVPVMLSAWGVPMYGQWLVLSAIPTYVALSDLSFSNVAGNSMVMLRASGRHVEAVALGRRLWSIVTAMSVLAAFGAVVIAFAIGPLLDRESPIGPAEVQVVLVALLLHIVVDNQFGVLDAWYRAAGRYPTGATLRQASRLVEWAALLGAVILGARPGMAAIVFLLGGLTGLCVSWVVLRRVVPWSEFRIEAPHLPTARQLAAPGMAFAAFPVGNALAVQGFTIAIGATLGATAVVVFSTTRTLTRMALQAMASINAAIAPELSRAVGAGYIEEARNIVRHAVQLSVGLSAIIVAGMAVLGPEAIAWWTRGLVEPDEPLLYVLLLGMLANAVWYTLSATLIATNHHHRLAALYLSGTFGALVLWIPASQALGLVGSALSLLVIDVLLTIYVFHASARLLSESPGRLLRSVLTIPKRSTPDASSA